MPTVTNIARVKNLSPQDTFEILKKSTEIIKAKDIQINEISTTPFRKEIKMFVPSMWGWGGFPISTIIYEENQELLISLEGSIAQLVVSPLTEKMDKLLKVCGEEMKSRNALLEYEKLTRFIPKYKLKYDRRDLYILIASLLFGLATELPRLLLNLNYVSIAPAFLIMGILFTQARHYIEKSKKPKEENTNPEIPLNDSHNTK